MIARYGGVGFAAQNVRIKMYNCRAIEKDGMVFNSKAEVAFYEFLKRENVEFIAHPSEYLTYECNGKIHKYFPDFIVNGKYVEIKGKHLIDENRNLINPWTKTYDDELKAKQQCMKENSVIIVIAQKEYTVDMLPELF